MTEHTHNLSTWEVRKVKKKKNNTQVLDLRNVKARERLTVKSTACSSKRPGFNFQHSQFTPLTPVTGFLIPSHKIYTQAKHQ